MNLKYYEKIAISGIVFIGVLVFTTYTMCVYFNRTKDTKSDSNKSGSIILENINL